MNRGNDDIARFDDANLETKWLLQEDALGRECLHLDPAGDDSRA